ncbi:MAG: phage replication initiation protein [Ruminococcus sp.]
MGSHRMFTNAVTDSDLFLEMPLSAQALYFHLGLHADDDGFVSSPKRIARSVGCNEDDIKLLVAKGFVLCFDSGIIVITHWNLHNSIRKDRKKDTFFKTEKSLLSLENGIYSKPDNQLTTVCQPNVNQLSAQDKISKDKISKDKISKDKISKDKIDNMSTAVDSRNAFDYQGVVDLFNSVCVSLPKVQKLNDKRRKLIVNAEKLLGELTFEELFRLVENSDFLTGRNGKWNGCGFDWILQPESLTKIIEGNYLDKASATVNTTTYTPRNYDEEF